MKRTALVIKQTYENHN